MLFEAALPLFGHTVDPIIMTAATSLMTADLLSRLDHGAPDKPDTTSSP